MGLAYMLASTFLAEVEMEKHNRQSTVEMCKIFHESVRVMSEKFRAAERREVYVTPTSYLELLGAVRSLVRAKRGEVSSAKERYDVGLRKLNDTAARWS